MVEKAFEGKVAIVTGAAQGIGLAITRRLAEAGARVMMADVKAETLAASAEVLRGAGADVAVHAIDLQQVDRIREMVERAVEKFGRLDVLVNNAGVEFGGGFFEVTQQVWDTHLNINLRAMFFASQAAAAWMKDYGGGAVVNIASVQGAIFSAGFIPYTVSKSGVRGLTSAMAVALAPHGIRVNAVAPGWCNTSMNKIASDAAAVESRLRLIPMHRICEPEEIADAVAFLAGGQAGYITGQTITVDGGRTLGAPPG